jgi:predicted enzyme related to lactoylglutathione lyase
LQHALGSSTTHKIPKRILHFVSVMNRVYTFDLPVDDMERARKFYEEVFGWVIAPVFGSGGNYHSAITVPSDKKGEPKVPGGINGGFYQRGMHGLTGTFFEIKVPSINSHLKKIETAGGTTVLPKGPISDLGFFAAIKDTEGNIIGL